MGKLQPLIDEPVKQFIERQRMFFVATAPLDPHGLVNLSPKGLDSIRILAPDTIAYLDLTGSGIETIAHVKENGRLVIMFCAFEGPPKILRLHGRGRVVEAGTPEFASLIAHFNLIEGMRAIIVMKIQRISDSCGMAVPLLKFEKDRHQLLAWAKHKGPEGLKQYRAEKNATSLDGLPGLAP
jgi:Pyridoxamine 5'-phosphate oxidase